jgi:hypothetical protein
MTKMLLLIFIYVIPVLRKVAGEKVKEAQKYIGICDRQANACLTCWSG